MGGWIWVNRGRWVGGTYHAIRLAHHISILIKTIDERDAIGDLGGWVGGWVGGSMNAHRSLMVWWVGAGLDVYVCGWCDMRVFGESV